jgi:hypothetical protein
MKLRNFRPVDVSEIAEASDENSWMDAYMQPRDQQLQALTQVGQKHFSLEDNANAEIRDVEVLHNTEIEIATNVKGGARVVLDGNITLGKLIWRPIDLETIGVTYKFDTDPGVRTAIRIVVWGR